MLLDRSNRQHANTVLCDSLANLGPGEFFVAILLGHVENANYGTSTRLSRHRPMLPDRADGILGDQLK
jgi:hypothetical protein